MSYTKSKDFLKVHCLFMCSQILSATLARRCWDSSARSSCTRWHRGGYFGNIRGPTLSWIKDKRKHEAVLRPPLVLHSLSSPYLRGEHVDRHGCGCVTDTTTVKLICKSCTNLVRRYAETRLKGKCGKHRWPVVQLRVP